MEKNDQVPSVRLSHEIQNGDIQPSVDQLSLALEKRIRLKTDLVILPLIVLTSTLAFLDKVSILSQFLVIRVQSLIARRMAWPTQQFTA